MPAARGVTGLRDPLPYISAVKTLSLDGMLYIAIPNDLNAQSELTLHRHPHPDLQLLSLDEQQRGSQQANSVHKFYGRSSFRKAYQAHGLDAILGYC